jgi:serine/threonine protein kinase
MTARGHGGLSRYRRDAQPLGHSTHAVVWRAVNKMTGDVVALKSVRGRSTDAIARMAREIEVGQRMGLDNSVMPVLDAAPDSTWFTMPLAVGDAEALWPHLGPDVELLRILDALSDGLGAAHAAGYVHRDIKPSNVLMLPTGQWAVADWGLVRRPRGETSHPARTETGIPFGTFGFAAPELSENAHDVTQAVDIYSVGQFIGWARTGRHPRANLPLLPDDEPWRTIVRHATLFEPEDRPVSVDEIRASLRTLGYQLDPAERQAQELLRQAILGVGDAGKALISLAVTEGASDKVLPLAARLAPDATRAAVLGAPASAALLARRLATVGQQKAELPLHVSEAIAAFSADILDAAYESDLEDLRHDAERAFTVWSPALGADARWRLTGAASNGQRATRWLRRARPVVQVNADPRRTAASARYDTIADTREFRRNRPHRGRARYVAALSAAMLVTLVVKAESVGHRPRSGAAPSHAPQSSSSTPAPSHSPTSTPARTSSPKGQLVSVPTPHPGGTPSRTPRPMHVSTTTTRTSPITVPTTSAPPTLPKPCWKYEPAYFEDPDRQDYVAPIGTSHTQSFYQLDWYPTRVDIVRVNSDCSQTTVFVSDAGDKRTFSSFVGQQWALIAAKDYYVNGEISQRKGEVLWYDTAGRRNFSSMNGVPDGYDAQPIPPCC